ncbi:MAG: hypothetical protein J1F66_04560 [Clostridiales bacterium]|nr:hypothetical protein [Clostridiales bacterium]
MERSHPCTTTDNEMIKDMSIALLKCGIDEGANYYEADEYSKPYFKISKKFKKESDNDPEVCYIYIDVDDAEYTVHGRYIHEHLSHENKAVNLVLGLLSGAIAEVVLVFLNKMAGFFLLNTGDPEKNVNVINDNAETIMEHLSSRMASAPNVHGHIIFSAAFPYYLQYGGGRQPQIEGVQIYMLSSVFAEHPEYYIIQ